MDFFKNKLEQLKEKNLYRQLKISEPVDAIHIKQNGKKYLSFCSNDYFGLSQDNSIKHSAINALKKYGFGSGASRYITGNNSLYQKLENKIAKLKNTDDAIVFGSGYLAGIGAIPALVDQADLIIADKLIHSSLLDGAKLSQAKLIRFQHNDINHAQTILAKERINYKKCLIITETVFSMDGDLGKVSDLLVLARKYECLVLSDDAHGIGIIEKNYQNSITHHIQLGTLSKAVGGYGGYVAGHKIIIDYLRNFAKSAIYSTALPASVLAGNLKSLTIIEKKPQLQVKALANANYFCQMLKLPKPESAIVVIIIGDATKTMKIASNIAKEGFLVAAIRPPTVEPNKSRLRITFSTSHRKSDITKLAKIVDKLLKREGQN